MLGFPAFPEAHGDRKLMLLVIISNIILFTYMPRIGSQIRNYYKSLVISQRPALIS